MNKDFSDYDFREEELFKKFLEKEKNGGSIFEADTFTDKEAMELRELEELESFESAYSDDKEIEDLGDILPVFKTDGKKDWWTVFKSLFAKDNARRISVLAIPGFLILMFIINVIVPSKDISQKENRALAQFPKFTLSSLADGSFTRGFENYISDQFVFRNFFVSAKRSFETMIVKKENHGIIMGKDGYLIENSSDLTRDNIAPNLEGINALAKSGRYNVKVAILPTAYEIMTQKLPKNAYTNVYGKLQSTIKNTLTADNITIADTAPVLKEHKDEQLYYRTDHHQTSHASYWVYSALGETLGYEPYKKEKFKIDLKADDFWGTTWSNSGFSPSTADSVHKYTLENASECSVKFPTEDKEMNTLYSDKMLKTKDKYAYFLDGNHGITEIKTSTPGGRRLAIVKDSYAHSLVPFFTNHYSRIYMIDLRYFSGDIFEYLYGSDVKDVLVLYNQNTFMTDTNLSKITGFAKNSPYNNVPEFKSGIVPEMEKVNDSYFDDALFVGDSLTMGISYFSGFNSEFMCMAGMSTRNLNTDKLPNGKTVYESIAAMEHIGKIYIMLGTNEAIYEKKDEYIARYGEFIDYVRSYFPNVTVYVESIMPMSESRSATAGLKNYMITDHNEALKKLAQDKACYYIDLNAFFAGEDGFLPEGAGGDGIHLSPDNYRVLADYLRRHAVDAIGLSTGKVNKTSFTGGRMDTEKIAKDIISKVSFKDKLSLLADNLTISNYNLDTKKVVGASLFMGGGSTAEEVAVFELASKGDSEYIVDLIKNRVEKKKNDFRGYIPAEMTKLESPVIVVKGNVVVLCIADEADKDTIAKCIN